MIVFSPDQKRYRPLPSPAHKERVAAIMEQEEERMRTAVAACQKDAERVSHEMVQECIYLSNA